MHQSEIRQIPTEELIRVLREREKEFFCDEGLLHRDAYGLRVALGAVVCVDGIAVQELCGQTQLLAIRRNSGPFVGKLCFVGGIIGKYELAEKALRRQFLCDLGVGIDFLQHPDQPAFVCQYARPTQNGFLPEPTKDHCVALTFLVKLQSEDFRFGSTRHGGQEASEVVWFSEEKMPPPSEFGYGQDQGYRRAFSLLKKLP